MIPAPLPVADLDENEVVHVGQVGAPITEGGDVDAVVDDDEVRLIGERRSPRADPVRGACHPT